MKGLVILVVIILFLISFISAIDIGITSSAIKNNTVGSANTAGNSENEIQTCLDSCPTGCASPENRICASDGERYCNTCTILCYGLTEADNSVCNPVPVIAPNTESANKVISAISSKYTNLTAAQIKNIIQNQNQLRIVDRTRIPCPTSCICTGSSMKCLVLGSGREMTISAGNSGNVIIQINGKNMTTNVTLYKSADGKVYGIFKDNETRRIRMLPDQISERVKEKLSGQIENENITLDSNGTYLYTGEKKARLFFIFPVNVGVDAKVDSETGNVISLKSKWWAFLAKDESSSQIVGASCGTVTPGSNDQCCKNKGYDVWNVTSSQCEFSS